MAGAAALRSDAASPGRRVGAALIKAGKLIAVGWNKYYKSHPSGLYSIHAEHAALIARRHYGDIHKATMYVYRARVSDISTGKLGIGCSKPCENCLALLREAGVSRVMHYDASGNICQLQL